MEQLFYLKITSISSFLISGIEYCSPLHNVDTTPLQSALDCSTVGILLRHGADPNVRNNWGFTPLHKAVSRGNLEIVQLLVDAGGNPTLKNIRGETPLHFALDCNLPLYRDHPLDTSQRKELAKRLVEALLSRGACLSATGLVSREMVQWASSELWYPDLIFSDD